jgi:4-hydroxy-4-methyl-2-oxoglutarate aldolase
MQRPAQVSRVSKTAATAFLALCAGALVNPGDVVVADDDGVVIVPTGDVARVAAVAQKREDLEGEKRARLAGGVLGLDMYNMRGPLDSAGLRYID